MFNRDFSGLYREQGKKYCRADIGLSTQVLLNEDSHTHYKQGLLVDLFNQNDREKITVPRKDPKMKNMLDSIKCGDATTILQQLPNQCADLIITSPPYYLQRTYNNHALSIGQEKTPEHYLEALFETFAECIRVIKPTGNIVYNLGDKYLNGSLLLMPFRFATIICDRFPVKLVNEITWVKKKSYPTPV